MTDDDQLEELRRQRLAQLQAEAQQQGGYDEMQASAQAEAQRQQAEAQKESLLRQILEPEARERLTRVKMARPDVASAVENQLIMLYQQGRVRQRIDDPTLRRLLQQAMPKGRETTIERK